jgi:hypothetical protein
MFTLISLLRSPNNPERTYFSRRLRLFALYLDFSIDLAL